MACESCRKAGLPAKLVKQLQQKLQEIEPIYAGTTTSFVITPQGNILVSSNHAETISVEELPKIMVSLKRSAALTLGEALPSREKQCNAIHIKGVTQLWSCYDVGENLLVFYTKMDKHMSQRTMMDFSASDSRMADLCEELRQLLSAA
mmetsp:Transcript_8972/g.12348  ORF Transcript_8972/g.12348 Transcript_8972/m.12348 type:complete len:148 (+) Transcript_8972:119-562(+)|eukprot:CAMPEP_0168569986 /NCGR_PEP_ID=MMETSP0413-20121227/16475_1 /TAXON_ID=136452 /ORGANISM="Filamoeba nolandi, Strain NC-AS-23-1" /LENGTH=147 /DNA_ID=CAMNT_0008602569 /DNA_START=64 /DNA_END=507 /DNA_ORIENTATION=-